MKRGKYLLKDFVAVVASAVLLSYEIAFVSRNAIEILEKVLLIIFGSGWERWSRYVGEQQM